MMAMDDISERNEKNPIYLAHILEHDYLVKGENDKVSLGGVVIGLALNSVHYYQEIQYGATFEKKIAHDVVEREGKEIAAGGYQAFTRNGWAERCTY